MLQLLIAAMLAQAEVQPVSLNDAKTLSQEELANRLLGPGWERAISKVEFVKEPHLGLTDIRLTSAPAPYRPGYCFRSMFTADFERKGDAEVHKDTYMTALIRRSDDCRSDGGNRWIIVNPAVDIYAVASLLSELAHWQGAVRKEPANLEISCQDELDQGACNPSPAEVFAGLPLDSRGLASWDRQGAYKGIELSLWPDSDREELWQLRATKAPGGKISLTIVHRLPAPF